MKPSEELEVVIPDDPRPTSVSPLKIFIVLILCLLGPIAGLTVWLQSEPLYESEAKLMVRYVVERSVVDEYESRREPMKDGLEIMDTEVEIITSRDLALQVAEKLGPERLAPDGSRGEQSIAMGADVIQAGLEAESRPGSNVIVVRFRCAEPDLAAETLEALIAAYFEMHLRIHRGGCDFDLVTQQADQIRTMLRQREDDLRRKREDPEADALHLQDLEERHEDAREAYRESQKALGKARIEEAFDATNMPNISFIQRPSTPVRVRDERVTTLGIMLAIAGPVLGALFSLVPMGRRP